MTLIRYRGRLCIAVFFLAGMYLLWATHYVEAQSERPLTLPVYIDRLELAIVELSGDKKTDGERLKAARTLVDEVQNVRLPSGEIMTVRPVLEGDITANLALDRLMLLHKQLLLADNDQTAARLESLNTIYDRVAQPQTLKNILRRWLEELLAKYLPGTDSQASEYQIFGNMAEGILWVVGLVGAIAISLMLSYWFQGIVRNFVSDGEVHRRDGEGEVIPFSASEAQKQAAMLAQSGDYRQAVRQLYLSALFRLEEHGLVQYDRSLTNQEMLQHIVERQEVHDILKPVVDTFDNTWYGIHEPDPATFNRFQHQIESLENSLTESKKRQET